jgi:hypothetical protein
MLFGAFLQVCRQQVRRDEKSLFGVAFAKTLGLLDFQAGWCFAFGLYALYALWASQSKIIFPALAWDSLGYFCAFLVVKILFQQAAISTKSIPRHIIAAAQPFFLGCEYIILCRSLGVTLWALSYLRCTFNFPLIDPQLSQTDHLIGIDWLSLFHWTVSGPAHFILRNAYESVRFQLFFFSVWCAWFSRKDRMYETLWILFSALLLTIVIAGFLPALGPADALGLTSSFNYVHNQGVLDFLAIRSGNVPSVTISNIGGIVAFPSFHTIAALVYIYAFREYGVVGIAALLLNLLMLIATPAFGDHYVVDMIAALPVASVSIIGVRWLSAPKKVAFIRP